MSTQDTDISPFDTGAYASRQTFVTGTAVRHCAEILRDKILAYAKTLLPDIDTTELELRDNWIWAGGESDLSFGTGRGELLQPDEFLCADRRSLGTGEKKYHCDRLLFCRG